MPNFFGNGLANNLNGSIFSDNMFGFGGNDNIFGNGGNDFIVGGAGNDFMNGGTGADVMVGGEGSDTYIVDSAGDLVVEDFGEGIDRVFSSVGFSTINVAGRFAVENLSLIGTAAVGIGNSLNNSIAGNGFNNTLNGLFGADNINGLGGNDFIIGGAGRDVLTGGTGNDIFDYNAASDSPTGIFSRDLITDFDDFGNDTIDLSGVVAGSLTFRGQLAFNGANQVRISDIFGPDVVVEVNLGGTLAPEMQIQLANTTAASMVIGDFIL
jgi:Ca2+-binding RTX toxin-like protein